MVGGLQDFNVRPSPFGTNWVFELIGTWFWIKGLGRVFDNKNPRNAKNQL